MFADDVGLLAQSRRLAEAARLVEADVIEVHRWSIEKKLHLNISKCEVTFFSPDTSESKPQAMPPIMIDSVPLKFNPTPKFLGIVYDRTLSFAHQAKAVARKVAGTSRLLTAVSGKDWGWNTRDVARVYQALALSAVRYCSPGWGPWLSKSNVMAIERAQHKCLRAITGQYLTAPVESLRLEGGFSTIATVVKRDAAVAMEKSLRLPITNPRYQIATKQVRHRTVRGSWRELATSQVRNTILEREPRCTLPPPTSAPWQWGSLDGKVRLDLLGGSRRTHSEGSRLVDAIATISSYGPLDLTIFTDGSVEEGAGESGSAAVFCRGTLANLQVIDVQGRQGAKLASSFDAEVTALRVATEWLVRRGVPGRYLICSDSRAALAALQSGSATTSADLHELRQRLRGVPGEIFLQWVPGHCGLPGNELADRAAGAARHVAGPRLGISYGSAKAFCRRTIRDPPRSP